MNVSHGLSKLDYGNRFGETVRKAALDAAAQKPEALGVTPRYDRWFQGEDGSPEPMATASKKFCTIEPGMAAGQIMAITKDNLAILGEDASRLFMEKLPEAHRMRRAIRSSVLSKFPHLGVCKFGEIITEKNDDGHRVTQVFVANFDGVLNPFKVDDFCTPISRGFDQMFYGIHIVVDRNGNVRGLDRDRGQNGIAFRTKDMANALFSVASLSTGLSMEALKAMAPSRK